LVKNGRDPETPAALIRWGTVPEQVTVTGKLSDIADVAESARIKPPVIIVVGEVVALREKLNWFESLPLFGKKVLVTRAREQAGVLSERLRELGADALEFPTIEILPPEDWTDVDHGIKQADTYDWIIFTSVNGVRCFLDRLLSLGRDVRDLKGPKVCAIGPGTAQELLALRVNVDFVPAEYRAEEIFKGLQREDLKGKKILIPRARVARDVLPEELRRAGAVVDVVEVYRTVRPTGNVDEVRDFFRGKAISAVTFTSSSTVSNFVEMFGEGEARDLVSGVVVASIGPVTAGKARSLGIETTVMPKDYTIPALADALAEYFRKH
ncbi:MAG TPA: uroporphyrinogen-III synthase, partial [Thermodesulfobacteriota bacterium]|nr:uroporphyrinogen-III synthase [Thermodesulfobacteriota bacterium]